MAKIISGKEGERLNSISEIEAMLSDKYLTDESHFQTKFILEQFFNHFKTSQIVKDRLRLLNISLDLPSTIVDKFVDYVGQPQLPDGLDVDLDDYISHFIWGGYSVFSPQIAGSEFKVSPVHPDEFINDGDGSTRRVQYLSVSDEKELSQKYLFQRKYYPLGVIENKLFKVAPVSGAEIYQVDGEEVSLDSIPATAGIPQFENSLLGRSPIVVVNGRKRDSKIYGYSEIKRVRSLITSTEVEVINIQDQFLKHLQAKMALPMSAGAVDKETGKLNVKDLEAFFVEANEMTPTYIFNENPLISKSFEFIKDSLTQICAILSLPPEFLGLKETGGAESTGTKRIRIASFIKKVEKIRSKFETGLRAIFDTYIDWFGNPSGQEFFIMWPEIFPEGSKDVADEMAAAKDAKLISHKKAVMKYQGLTEQEAEEEIKIINEENATVDESLLPV